MINPLALIKLHPRATLALAVVLALVVAVFLIRRDAAQDAVEGRDRADAAALAQDAQTNALATEAVQAETKTTAAIVAAQTENLTDALQTVPPGVAGPAAVVAACLSLCEQGDNVETYPACRAGHPFTRTQAGPGRFVCRAGR